MEKLRLVMDEARRRRALLMGTRGSRTRRRRAHGRQPDSAIPL